MLEWCSVSRHQHRIYSNIQKKEFLVIMDCTCIRLSVFHFNDMWVVLLGFVILTVIPFSDNSDFVVQWAVL